MSKRIGIKVKVVPDDADGALDLEKLQAILAQDKSVKLIALTHVPTNGGLV